MQNSQTMRIEELQKLLVKWGNRYHYEPLVFKHFADALYYLTDFIGTTLDSYSVYSGTDIESVVEANRQIQADGNKTISMGTIMPMIIDNYFVPRLYGLSYLGAWGLLERYLKDVLWIVVTENLAFVEKPRRYVNHAKKVKMEKELLARYLVESRKQNLDEIINLYKELLGIDLRKNENFAALFEVRKKRNRLAHTGELLGYKSFIELESNWKQQDEQNKFITKNMKKRKPSDNQPIKGPVIIHATLEYRDPATTDRNKELETEYCKTIVNIWKLGDYLTARLFERSRRLP